MKSLKVVWGRVAQEQKALILQGADPSKVELVEKAQKHLAALQAPFFYESPDGWFTKTTWNQWGEGVELSARVDFEGGFLVIMEIKERMIQRRWMALRTV